MPAKGVRAEIHGFSEPDSTPTPTPWAVGIEHLPRGGHLLTIDGPSRRSTAHHAADRCLACGGALVRAGRDERKARNLAKNPSCVLATGRSDLVDGALDLMIEGRAEQVAEHAATETPVGG